MQLSIIFLLIQYVFYTECLYGINIKRVKKGEYPFIVAISKVSLFTLVKEKLYICPGVLVSRRDILTSAAEVQNQGVSNLEVMYGHVDLRKGKRVSVEYFVTYNDWLLRRNEPNATVIDLAIIRISYDLNITPVVMSGLPITGTYGLRVKTAGWGKTNEGNMSRYLEAIDLDVINPTDCKTRILALTKKKITTVHKDFICTAGKQVAFLREGDSGGPLLYLGQLLGINRGACPSPDDNFEAKKINIHTVVDIHQTFILDLIHN